MSGRIGLEAGWLGNTSGPAQDWRGAWHINEVYQRLRRFSWPGLPGLPPPESFASFRNTTTSPVNALGRLDRAGEMTGNADGKQGMLSVFLRPRSMNSGSMELFRDGLNRNILFLTPSTGLLRVRMISAGSQGITMDTVTPLPVGGWAHLLASWDLNIGRAQLYLNDVPNLNVISGPTNVTIDYTQPPYRMIAAGDMWVDVSRFYLNLAESLDITNSANRRKFINSDGSQVFLGADGSTPTGNDPIVLFDGNGNAFADNRGYGGAWGLTGTLTED